MTSEFGRKTVSGWVVLPLLILAIGGLIYVFVRAAMSAAEAEQGVVPVGEMLTLTPESFRLEAGQGVVPAAEIWIMALCGLGLAIWTILIKGFIALQPNEAVVLLLFGKYTGTVREEGFHWANPFFRKIKVSLRTRNFNTDTLKVNDQRGNPTEIAAVVVWRVQNTAQATFDVDDYRDYVRIQSESALRHLASRYPYDTQVDGELSLRGSMDDVSRDLQHELQERLTRAGVVVEEARLSHLAYAPEIAGAMLRRQQAEAIVAARFRIVEGAVSMVELALERLEQKKTVELDDERKAAMVSNLLVVLCGEQAAQPVVNAGTLYSA